MQMYTDRQVALQAAVQYCNAGSNFNSFDVVMIAERFRKFIEEGIVETKADPAQGTCIGGHRSKVGAFKNF